jgi:hypothetical protein
MFDESSFIPQSDPSVDNQGNLEGGAEQMPGESGRAEKGSQGAPTNAKGQVVHDVGGKKVTTRSMKKSRQTVNNAALKKALEFIAKGRIREASEICSKVLGLSLEQVLDIGLNKGIIEEEEVVDSTKAVGDESRGVSATRQTSDSGDLDKVYFAILKKFDPNNTMAEDHKTKFINIVNHANTAYVKKDLDTLIDIAKNPDKYSI